MAVQKKSAKATPGRFVADVKKMRERARRHMQSGAVTESYRADRAQVIKVLNDVLATEIVCVLRYKSHFYFPKGLDAEPARAEFLQACGRRAAACGLGRGTDNPARRRAQLRSQGAAGTQPFRVRPAWQPDYDDPGGSDCRTRSDQSYSEIVRWLGNDDTTTRRIMEDILKMEEEHADDMANLLAKVG